MRGQQQAQHQVSRTNALPWNNIENYQTCFHPTHVHKVPCIHNRNTWHAQVNTGLAELAALTHGFPSTKTTLIRLGTHSHGMELGFQVLAPVYLVFINSVSVNPTVS